MAIGIMEVLLVSAKGLNDTDFFGSCDPYVVIEYKNQQHQSCVAQGQGKNPKWNEKFTFKVEYPSDIDHYKLILKIFDKDTFTADDFLGQATIYIEDLLALGVENGIAEHPPNKHTVVTADQCYHGEIQVGLTFNLTSEGDDDDEEGGWRDSE